LAVFKADILNAFVAENDLQTVIEFGCGDGNQLSLVEYPSYIGVDVSQTAVDLCARKFHQDDSKSFYLTGEAEPFTAQLSLSLDVIYHLVEDDVYEQYMRKLFDAALEYVVIYSSNYNDDFALSAKHVRHRKFTDWVAQNAPDFELFKEISNPYPFDENDPTNTSLADFHFFKKTDNGKK
jgi:protein O-GlcNAc transferase